ncbi:MAG: transcriptional regulator [Bacteroidetes bacterium]|nr:transcriptional regulator [Bacteroidota bacterium]
MFWHKQNIIFAYYLIIDIMAKDLFNRYIWLLDTINSRKSITFKGINNLWMHSSMNDDGEKLPKRTFHNQRKAIEDLFGLNIVCNHSNNEYSIENIDDLKSGDIKKWLLETFAVNNVICEKVALKDRIIMENIPSSHKYLSSIIEAMKENRSINITYKSHFSTQESNFDIEPYFIKLFKQIWYITARSPHYDSIRTYALDRVLDLKVNDKKFEYPKSINPDDYFSDYFGIITQDNNEVEKICIRVYREQVDYIRALPLHHSQKEIETKENYSDFSYRIKPTYDFKQAILSKLEDIEVLSPISFRKDIKATIERMAKLYKKTELD